MKKNFTTALLSLAVCAAALGLILFPKDVSNAVTDGLSMCSDVLLPTLFPFLVLSGFMIKSGLIDMVGRFLEPVMRPTFHLPGVCSSALLLGLVGGYPTGAKAAVTLYRDGLCTRQEAEQTLTFCNNCGPGFLLGSVGFGIFGCFSCGMILLVAHWLSAVAVGMFFAPPYTRSEQNARIKKHTADTPLHTAFVGSVTEAMQAFLNLSAFVLCFSAITQLAQLSGIINILAALFPLSQENSISFLLGLLEMTAGALHLGGGSETERMILASALIGWGGLSVHCQTLSLMQDTDLSPVPYFKGKALQALLAALLTAGFLGRFSVLWPPLLIAGYVGSGFRKKQWKKSGGYIIIDKK